MNFRSAPTNISLPRSGRKKLTEEVRGADTTTQLLGGRKRYALAGGH